MVVVSTVISKGGRGGYETETIPLSAPLISSSSLPSYIRLYVRPPSEQVKAATVVTSDIGNWNCTAGAWP